MIIYSPQTEIKSPWKEYFFILLFLWVASLAMLLIWTRYSLSKEGADVAPWLDSSGANIETSILDELSKQAEIFGL